MAVISGGDNKTVEAPKVVETSEKYNGSLPSSSSGGGLVDVRAVITIRKKMKEKIAEKLDEHWESFINGIGQGILIQLISQDLDPGKFLFYNRSQPASNHYVFVFFFFFLKNAHTE